MLFWSYNGVINRGGAFIIVRKSVNHVKVIVFSGIKPCCSVMHCSWPILDTIITSRRSGQYSIKWLHLVKTPDSMEVYRIKEGWGGTMKVNFSAELSDNWIAAPEWSNPPELKCPCVFLRTAVWSDWIQRESWAALSLKQCFCDALQHLVLYNFNNSVATVLLTKKKEGNTVALFFILGMVSTQVRGRHISSVSSSLPQLLSTNLIFVITVNLLHLWRICCYQPAFLF